MARHAVTIEKLPLACSLSRTRRSRITLLCGYIPLHGKQNRHSETGKT